MLDPFWELGSQLRLRCTDRTAMGQRNKRRTGLSHSPARMPKIGWLTGRLRCRAFEKLNACEHWFQSILQSNFIVPQGITAWDCAARWLPLVCQSGGGRPWVWHFIAGHGIKSRRIGLQWRGDCIDTCLPDVQPQAGLWLHRLGWKSRAAGQSFATASEISGCVSRPW